MEGMDMNDLSDLAAKVRAARKRRGWGQKDLADAAGIYYGTVSNFERGKSFPHPHHLRAILKALDLESEAGDETARESRSEWPVDVQTFVDLMALFLVALDEDERTSVMHDITRQIVNR